MFVVVLILCSGRNEIFKRSVIWSHSTAPSAHYFIGAVRRAYFACSFRCAYPNVAPACWRAFVVYVVLTYCRNISVVVLRAREFYSTLIAALPFPLFFSTDSLGGAFSHYRLSLVRVFIVNFKLAAARRPVLSIISTGNTMASYPKTKRAGGDDVAPTLCVQYGWEFTGSTNCADGRVHGMYDAIVYNGPYDLSFEMCNGDVHSPKCRTFDPRLIRVRHFSNSIRHFEFLIVLREMICQIPVILNCYYYYFIFINIIKNVISTIVLLFLKTSVIVMPFYYTIVRPESGFYILSLDFLPLLLLMTVNSNCYFVIGSF